MMPGTEGFTPVWANMITLSIISENLDQLVTLCIPFRSGGTHLCGALGLSVPHRQFRLRYQSKETPCIL